MYKSFHKKKGFFLMSLSISKYSLSHSGSVSIFVLLLFLSNFFFFLPGHQGLITWAKKVDLSRMPTD